MKEIWNVYCKTCNAFRLWKRTIDEEAECIIFSYLVITLELIAHRLIKNKSKWVVGILKLSPTSGREDTVREEEIKVALQHCKYLIFLNVIPYILLGNIIFNTPSVDTCFAFLIGIF